MKIIQFTILLLLFTTSLCFAEQKVFTQTVRYVMGEKLIKIGLSQCH